MLHDSVMKSKGSITILHNAITCLSILLNKIILAVTGVYKNGRKTYL